MLILWCWPAGILEFCQTWEAESSLEFIESGTELQGGLWVKGADSCWGTQGRSAKKTMAPEGIETRSTRIEEYKVGKLRQKDIN